MTPIAPHMSAFLQEHLPLQKGASVHTCDSYAYGFQLLFEYASRRYGVAPSALYLEQIDAPLVMDFLTALETDRHNTPRTRNVRLVAIKSFMRFIEYRVPSLLEQSRRILAIPAKRTDERLVSYLSKDEVEAILNAPDNTQRAGIRDRAMLHLCFAAGIRVTELVSLARTAVVFQPLPQVHIQGKGRRQRVLPLWKQTAADLRAWLAIRGDAPVPELFLNARRLSMTRFGFEYVLQKHAQVAMKSCPSLKSKRVSPHILRHYLPFLTMSGNMKDLTDLFGNGRSHHTGPLKIPDIVFSR